MFFSARINFLIFTYPIDLNVYLINFVHISLILSSIHFRLEHKTTLVNITRFYESRNNNGK